MSICKRSVVVAGLTVLGSLIAACVVLAHHSSLLSPPNVVWAVFSGYYQYDPHREKPPTDLFRERPEPSLTYFLDATLKRCGGSYPPFMRRIVTHYDIEQVEYFGHTDYHAFSHLHTRIYFADGTSARVVFRFEAGHNESYPLYVVDISTIHAGSWMAVGGLLRDPTATPPGWSSYDSDPQPTACNPGVPYAIEQMP